MGVALERIQIVMPILKAGVLYFALVFGAGFVLGTIRTLWVVPRFGMRNAELMETPIMLVVTIVAARWIVHRLAVPSGRLADLAWVLSRLDSCSSRNSGLCSGFGVCRSESISLPEDLVSGTVYYVMLGVFAIMPLLVARR